jgi:hypothetical protein
MMGLYYFYPTLMLTIYKRNTFQDNDKYNKYEQTGLPPNLGKKNNIRIKSSNTPPQVGNYHIIPTWNKINAAHP